MVMVVVVVVVVTVMLVVVVMVVVVLAKRLVLQKLQMLLESGNRSQSSKWGVSCVPPPSGWYKENSEPLPPNPVCVCVCVCVCVTPGKSRFRRYLKFFVSPRFSLPPGAGKVEKSQLQSQPGKEGGPGGAALGVGWGCTRCFQFSIPFPVFKEQTLFAKTLSQWEETCFLSEIK
jgi:hypothetical protein